MSVRGNARRDVTATFGGRTASGDDDARTQWSTAGTSALLAALPCAAVAAAAAVLLGPPLGRALLTPEPVRFLLPGASRPEPTAHARFLIAVLAPFALALAIALIARGRSRVVGPRAHAIARAVDGLVLAAAVFSVLAQYVLAYRVGAGVLYREHRVYFTGATLAVAGAIAVALVFVPRRPAARARLRSIAQETRARRLAAVALAVGFCALWLLTAFNTEGSIGLADTTVSSNVTLWLDETVALLNGLAPLAGFHAQYAQLWPYAAAGAMTLLGASLGVYAALAAACSGAAMLAVFAIFRRVVASSVLALALFVPFVATSFFKIHGTLANRYSPASLYSLFPIRYGGPYVLAWLLARRLDGRQPQRTVVLFFVAGLVALNNPEFGGPAFAATLAAALWTLPRPTWAGAARLVGAAAAGAVAATVAVGLLTLAVAGGLPHFADALEFVRIYGLDGFGMLPMPVAGFHLAIYLTFAAALALATVRSVDRARDVVLTGMLCWIGVFGLGIGGYYADRGFPDVLIELFSPWAFALMLLLVAAVRGMLARASRWPTAAELAVLAGFGVAVCSIAQTPTPWSQLARVSQRTPTPTLQAPAADRFVRLQSGRGEHVLIVAPLGHLIGYRAGVRDMFPYADVASAVTVGQWDTVMRLVREQRVRFAFVLADYAEVLVPQLSRAGFRVASLDRASRLVQLVRPVS